MKIKKLLSVIFCVTILFFSCNKEDDASFVDLDIPTLQAENEVNDFIYSAMNKWYLYKDEQPLLADDHFETHEDKIAFINNGGTPEEFFELLKVEKDEFSTLNNKANLKSKLLPSTIGFYPTFVTVNNTEVVGVVLQVIKGSNAERLGLKRGDLFNKIDGVTTTFNNAYDLISKSSFLLSRVAVKEINSDGDVIFENIDNLPISSESIEENPIVIAKTITISNTEIGYLFYKYFDAEYSSDLNQVFGSFKASGVKNFVIDLRYNSGGNELALYELASMLTGQFTGQIFLSERYNSDIQAEIVSGNLNVTRINNFRNKLSDGTAINSLSLSKLYVITSAVTASSSELLVHCLKPYIEVVVIGNENGTVGKGVSKTEMYDAPNYFSESDINSTHNYFLDLVRIQGLNKNAELLDVSTGVLPTIKATESAGNLGELGEVNEKLLSLAIDDILGR